MRAHLLIRNGVIEYWPTRDRSTHQDWVEHQVLTIHPNDISGVLCSVVGVFEGERNLFGQLVLENDRSVSRSKREWTTDIKQERPGQPGVLSLRQEQTEGCWRLHGHSGGYQIGPGLDGCERVSLGHHIMPLSQFLMTNNANVTCLLPL